MAGVRALAIRHVKNLIALEFEIDMFNLMDWCIGGTLSQISSPYWGVELRDGLSGVLGFKLHLRSALEVAIDSFVGIDVQNRPENAAIKWILLCRSISVGSGLKSEFTGAGDTAVASAEDGVEANDPSAMNHGIQEGKLSYEQFSNIVREDANRRAAAVVSVRSYMKCVALKCATAAFLGANRCKAHKDLSCGRMLTQKLLNDVESNLSIDLILNNMPCYMSLFVQDMINFGCACAAYSIDEQFQTALQIESVQFLQVVVSFFLDADDPDYLGLKSPDVEGLVTSSSGKLLVQYIAQIVSALRPCLSTAWAPSLLVACGGIVSDLISSGLLNDKVVIRRLIKSFLSASHVEVDSYSVRSIPSIIVSDEVNVADTVIAFTNVARIYLLCTKCSGSGDVDFEIKKVIAQSLQSNIEKLRDAWIAITLDAVRLIQGTKKWPKWSEGSDPRRGGVTYSSGVDTSCISSVFEFSLPYVIAAYCSCEDETKLCKPGRVPPVLSIAGGLLENVFSLPHLQYEYNFLCRGDFHSPCRTVRSSRSVIEPLCLSSLVHIARCRAGYKALICAEEFFEWYRIVVFIGKDVLPHRSTMERSADFFFLCDECINLVTALSDLFLTRVDGRVHDKFGSISLWSWVIMLSICEGFLPSLFSDKNDGISVLSKVLTNLKTVDNLESIEAELDALIFPKLYYAPMNELPEHFLLTSKNVIAHNIVPKAIALGASISHVQSLRYRNYFCHFLHTVLVQMSFYSKPAKSIILAIVESLKNFRYEEISTAFEKVLWDFFRRFSFGEVLSGTDIDVIMAERLTLSLNSLLSIVNILDADHAV